jgi:hypothetical protein
MGAPVSRRTFVSTVGNGVIGLAMTLPILGKTVQSETASTVGSAASVDRILTVVRGNVTLELTADVLSRFPSVTRLVGRSGRATSYSGVALSDLFAAVGADGSARARVLSHGPAHDPVVATALPPFTTAGQTALVATAINGRALDAGEGGPACLIVTPFATGTGAGPLGRLLRVEVLG